MTSEKVPVYADLTIVYNILEDFLREAKAQKQKGEYRFSVILAQTALEVYFGNFFSDKIRKRGLCEFENFLNFGKSNWNFESTAKTP